MKDKLKIICTGGRGFISSYLVRELRSLGYDTVPFDIIGEPKVNLLNEKELEENIKNESPIGAIYHLAGPVLEGVRKDQVNATKLTVNGTLNILEACRKFDIPKLFFSSTFYCFDGFGENEIVNEETKIDGLKAELFGSVKLFGESLIKEYCKKYGLNYVIFRFGSAYGPDERCSNVVKDFILKAKTGEKMDIWGKGNRKNQYTYVGDIAKGCVLALNEKNETFNLISPEQTSTGELARLIDKKIGFNYFFDESKPEGKSMPYMSSMKAINMLKWKSISINEGIDLVIGGMRI